MIQELTGYTVEDIAIISFFSLFTLLFGYFIGWVTEQVHIIVKLFIFLFLGIVFLAVIDNWNPDGSWIFFVMLLGFLFPFRYSLWYKFQDFSSSFSSLLWRYRDLKHRLREKNEVRKTNKVENEWKRLKEAKKHLKEEREAFFEEKKRLKNRDPYKILDVSRDDSLSEIKRRYKDLIKELHPDRLQCPDGYARQQIEDIVKQINWAFDEIKKDKKWWS